MKILHIAAIAAALVSNAPSQVPSKPANPASPDGSKSSLKPVSVTLPELTVRGYTYRSITLTKASQDKAAAVHSKGKSLIPFVELPESVSAKLGFDRSAYNARIAMAKIEADKQAARQAVLSQSIRFQLYVDTVLPNGLLGRAVFASEKNEISIGMHEIVLFETKTSGMEYLSDKVYEFYGKPNGTFTYTTVLGSDKTVRRIADIDPVLKALEKQQPPKLPPPGLRP